MPTMRNDTPGREGPPPGLSPWTEGWRVGSRGNPGRGQRIFPDGLGEDCVIIG